MKNVKTLMVFTACLIAGSAATTEHRTYNCYHNGVHFATVWGQPVCPSPHAPPNPLMPPILHDNGEECIIEVFPAGKN